MIGCASWNGRDLRSVAGPSTARFSEELQREWFWKERYSSQPEILRYLRHVTDRFDLRRSMRLGIRVTGMRRDEQRNLWTLTTDAGRTYTARFVVLATGPLNEPKKLDIPGVGDYTGELYETSRWPHRPVSFEGKRVAVIGTGPSGLQTITEVARLAGQLTVFQRTPTFTAPARNGPTDPQEFAAFQARYAEQRREMKQTFNGSSYFASGKSAKDCTPEERQAVLEAFWQFGGIGYVWAFTDVLFDQQANAIVADFLREKMAAQIADPALREKLLPRDYPVGTRRPCCDSGYLEAFNRANVTLVDLRETPMVRFTESAIETTDGHREFDVIIVAIGFDALTGAATAIDPVNGRGERRRVAGRRPQLHGVRRSRLSQHVLRQRPAGALRGGQRPAGLRERRRLHRRLPRLDAAERPLPDRTDPGGPGSLDRGGDRHRPLDPVHADAQLVHRGQHPGQEARDAHVAGRPARLRRALPQAGGGRLRGLRSELKPGGRGAGGRRLRNGAHSRPAGRSAAW